MLIIFKKNRLKYVAIYRLWLNDNLYLHLKIIVSVTVIMNTNITKKIHCLGLQILFDRKRYIPLNLYMEAILSTDVKSRPYA